MQGITGRVILISAIVLTIVAAANASNLNFTFEDPPYVVGQINGQDGWTNGSGTVYVTNTSPLSGSQSMLINDPGAYVYASHGLASQTFADGMILQWKIKVNSDETHVSINNTGGLTYNWVKFSLPEGVIRVFYGQNCSQYVNLGVLSAGTAYKCIAVFDFTNHKLRVIVENLTDRNAPKMDTLQLAMDTTVTAANAGGSLWFWGIGTSYIDDVVFAQAMKEVCTTDYFMASDYNMLVSGYTDVNNTVTVESTGATCAADRNTSVISLTQKIPATRGLGSITFSDSFLSNMSVQQSTDGATILSSANGQIKIQNDSIIALKPNIAVNVTVGLGFTPLWSALDSSPNYLLLDMDGGLGIFPKGLVSNIVDHLGLDGTLQLSISAGQEVVFSVCPPRAYDWQKSFNDRLVTHYTVDPQTVYPTDAQIAGYTQYGNILLLASDATLWQNWWLGYEPINSAELTRVINTCHANGMKLVLYVSPGFYVNGTPMEGEARIRVPKAGEVDMNTRIGENADLFLAEIQRLCDRFDIDGLYFDGLYLNNAANSYYVVRKTRQILGSNGTLIVHTSDSPPRFYSYLYWPSIDTYSDYIMRGERESQMWDDPAYLRCLISTYNISNTIGMLVDSVVSFIPDQVFLDRMLNNNIRMFLNVTPKDPVAQYNSYSQYYWPRLNNNLITEVDSADDVRTFPATPYTPIPTSSLDLLRDDFSSGAGNWTVLSGNWSVTDGVYKHNGPAEVGLSVAGSSTWKNYTYQVRTQMLGHADYTSVPWYKSYITFRLQDANNFYRFGYHGDIYRFNLLKFVNGQPTVIADSEGWRGKPNTWYTLKVTVIDDWIRCYVNDELVIDTKDSQFATGKVGLYVDNALRAAYDEVAVVSANSEFTFENPPYTTGQINGQNGWTNASGTGSVTNVAPLSGSQSLLINDPGAYAYNTHSLADQPFTTGTKLKWLVKVHSGETMVNMGNTVGSTYHWVKFSPGEPCIRVWYGNGASQYVTIANRCDVDGVYSGTTQYNFTTQQFRVKVQNLTDPSQPVADSGWVALDSGTTTTTAKGTLTVWGTGESRIDDLLFDLDIFTTLWSDGFESGNFTAGGWTNGGCATQTTYKYSGTYAAVFNSSDSLIKTCSTSGRADIKVEYARYTRLMETDDHFISEWSTNGTTWTTMEDLTGNSAWTVKQYQLPSEADNQSGFRIRFKTVHNGSTDYAYLDDVKIIGL
ncbi:MAG: family 16 glycoside hydrolase [Armatimonadota bacterium]